MKEGWVTLSWEKKKEVITAESGKRRRKKRDESDGRSDREGVLDKWEYIS